MHERFADLIASLDDSYRRLVAIAPCVSGKLPPEIPKKGVYLFSESGRHLYVGRSNNIRERYGNHTQPGSPQNSAAFAMILAKDEVRHVSSYKSGPGSLKSLKDNAEFNVVFKRQKKRIRAMEFRWVAEDRLLQQALLEIYCAVVLCTPHNSFDNH